MKVDSDLVAQTIKGEVQFWSNYLAESVEEKDDAAVMKASLRLEALKQVTEAISRRLKWHHPRFEKRDFYSTAGFNPDAMV